MWEIELNRQSPRYDLGTVMECPSGKYWRLYDMAEKNGDAVEIWIPVRCRRTQSGGVVCADFSKKDALEDDEPLY
jgi:hypothetical protein